MMRGRINSGDTQRLLGFLLGLPAGERLKRLRRYIGMQLLIKPRTKDPYAQLVAEQGIQRPPLVRGIETYRITDVEQAFHTNEQIFYHYFP